MDNKSYTFRGRRRSKKEIEIINKIIKEKKYRTAISRKVCEVINLEAGQWLLKGCCLQRSIRGMDKQAEYAQTE